MSAVVEAVSNVVEDVVEGVGDVVEDVVDVVEDVAGEVSNVVEDTFQAIKEDPVSFAIQLAVTAVGIPPPVTAAAITAAKGGDIEDIGKAALAAAIAPEVGKAAGQVVARSVADTALNQTLQQTLTNAAASAAAGATSAVIQGGDIGQTALMGAAGGAAGTLAGIGAAELGAGEKLVEYAERAGQVAATGGDVGAALINKGLQDLGKYGTSKEQANKEEVAAETPMTREEIADATFEMLKSEFERAKELEGGTQVAAAEGETMTDVPAGYYRLPDGGLGIRTDITTTGVPELPAVEVTADMNVGDLTDAQIIDLVRAGQRRNRGEEGGAPGTTAPAEGEAPEDVTRLPDVVVEAPAEDEDISDEEILDLVKIGMEKEGEGAGAGEGEGEGEGEGAGEGKEAIPEGEMELGGGEGEGATPVTPKVYGTPVVAKDIVRSAGLPARQVGQGYSAIVGDKEPTFGGDEGPQSEVWNRRSLRLRKALGL
jgi:hypothetical protein